VADPIFTSLNAPQRLLGFAIAVFAGLVMLSLALAFLPRVLLGSPAKFAMSYTIGNVFLLVSSCFYSPPSRQLASLWGGEGRASAFTIFVVAMSSTLYFTVGGYSMFLILTCVVAQLCALFWYLASYVPLGQRCLSTLCSGTFRRVAQYAWQRG
jgi:hypothetical protein